MARLAFRLPCAIPCLVLVAFLFRPAPAAGQAPGARPGRGPAGSGRSLPHPGIKLRDDQREAIRQLMQDQRETLQAIHRAEGLSPGEKERRVKETRDAFQQKMNELLTPEQREKLEGFRSQFRIRFGESHGEISARIAEQLGLREEQRTRFSALLEAQAAAIRDVINDQALDMSRKTGRINEIRVDTARSVNELLDPDQRTIHEEIREKTRERFLRQAGSVRDGARESRRRAHPPEPGGTALP